MGEHVTGKLKIPQGSSMLMICIKSRGPGNAKCVSLMITCICTRLHKLEHYVFLAHYASSLIVRRF